MPVISENNSLTNLFNISYYNELYDENVSKISLYLKATTSLTNDDVRVSKRLYVPSSRLRGFESGKVGPKDGNDYVGGNYATTANFELALPNFLPESTKTDIGFFFDVGNVWGVDYDSTINDSNKIRSSTGFGMDILTPVGPLSFSLTQPLTKKSTDKTETFRFNLGTTF